MRIILESYKKIFSLILLLVFTVIVTFLIKYYFKPFMVILIMSIICMPVYKFIIKLKVPEKLAGAVTLITVNVLLVLIIVYMGGEIYSILRKVYSSNKEIINNIIRIYQVLLILT